MLQQLFQMNTTNPLHQYLTTTASITTTWFFFACTINASLVVLVTQFDRKDYKFKQAASLLATLIGINDLILAAMYCPFIPAYYIFSYFCSAPRTYHLLVTLMLWSFVSIILSGIMLVMGSFWMNVSFRHNDDVVVAAKRSIDGFAAWRSRRAKMIKDLIARRKRP
jgi:membrane-associated HD superfamily phosphohydrolase